MTVICTIICDRTRCSVGLNTCIDWDFETASCVSGSHFDNTWVVLGLFLRAIKALGLSVILTPLLRAETIFCASLLALKAHAQRLRLHSQQFPAKCPAADPRTKLAWIKASLLLLPPFCHCHRHCCCTHLCTFEVALCITAPVLPRCSIICRCCLFLYVEATYTVPLAVVVYPSLPPDAIKPHTEKSHRVALAMVFSL